MVLMIYLYLVLTAILLTGGGVLYILGHIFKSSRVSNLGIGVALLSWYTINHASTLTNI